MKKIMFDNYLTEAVKEGRKNKTRRIVSRKTLIGANEYVQRIHGSGHDFLEYLLEHSRYKVGEIVAVAQAYKDALNPLDWINNLIYRDEPGWTNKMFVRADLMPLKITIKNVSAERIQDIRDEDCTREGITEFTCNLYEYRGICYSFGGDKSKIGTYKTPRAAFAALIDKASGKGTWKDNPYVYVYEFELHLS